ncbi:MAG: hypothetical protein GXP04_04270 [Alphaproteobacteria bacterium]|nr:hypothetical protein [Alphaproteobacteria bacterium]
MLSMFSGGQKDEFWPLSKVVGDLKRKYGKADELGEDGPLKVYGVEDNGVNFVVAVMQTAPGSGKIIELGLLARFIGFPVDARMVGNINQKLTISVASMEGADLFLMAGLQVTGAYDQSQFYMILETWRRDLMVTIQGINGDSASMTHGLPIGKLEAAYSFATNIAVDKGEKSGPKIDMLSQFFGGEGASKEFCDLCHGRGKRGFLSRTCDDCDGSGFVETRRR